MLEGWSFPDLAVIAWLVFREARRRDSVFFAVIFDEADERSIGSVFLLLLPGLLWGVALVGYIGIRIDLFSDRSVALAIFALIGMLWLFVSISVLASLFAYKNIRRRAIRETGQFFNTVWDILEWHL